MDNITDFTQSEDSISGEDRYQRHLDIAERSFEEVDRSGFRKRRLRTKIEFQAYIWQLSDEVLSRIPADFQKTVTGELIQGRQPPVILDEIWPLVLQTKSLERISADIMQDLAHSIDSYRSEEFYDIQDFLAISDKYVNLLGDIDSNYYHLILYDQITNSLQSQKPQRRVRKRQELPCPDLPPEHHRNVRKKNLSFKVDARVIELFNSIADREAGGNRTEWMTRELFLAAIRKGYQVPQDLLAEVGINPTPSNQKLAGRVHN